eukprot:g22713.t1
MIGIRESHPPTGFRLHHTREKTHLDPSALGHFFILGWGPFQEVEPLVRQPGGYDLHFRLNLTLDESIRRACGRRIDPATNLEYHIEDMPPPNKKAVIYERLVPADSLEKSTGTLTERIHCFDVAQPEASWQRSGGWNRNRSNTNVNMVMSHGCWFGWYDVVWSI